MVEKPIWYADARTGMCLGAHYRGAVPDVPYVEVSGDGAGEGRYWDFDAQTWGLYDPPPDSCTALQGRRALGMERVQQISALVAHLDLVMPHLSAEEIWEVQTAWEFATTWDREGREVNMLRDLYGMSPQERDDLMRLAVTL